MVMEIKKLSDFKAEELYPASAYCNSIVFDNYFKADPTLDEIRDWLESVKALERNREEIRFVVWEDHHRVLGWLAVRRLDDISDICYLDYNFCDTTRLLELMVETSRYAIDHAFNVGFTSEFLWEVNSGDTVTRKLIEEIPLEISFTDTAACRHERPLKEYLYSIHVDDPARDEWFSNAGHQCCGKESEEHPDWPVGYLIGNQSHDLLQVEIDHINAGSQAPRGLC